MSLKDVTDGRTDGWFYLLGIGRNRQILGIFSRICSNMLEYARIFAYRTDMNLIGRDGRTDARTDNPGYLRKLLLKMPFET
jgi:hypothetical protein